MSHFCNTSKDSQTNLYDSLGCFFRLSPFLVACIFYFILLMFFAFHAYAKEGISPSRIHPVFGAQSFILDNGLRVVVIENHRAPVVTHMLWIAAGAADEPESLSGSAHFLEHLMFKGTKTTPPGAYSKTLRAIGGEDNAFTSHDYTAYFATLPVEELPLLMRLERDRFLNLSPPASHAESEKQVVLEERRERTENDPLGPFYEQINAYLMAGTPYDKPVIGWSKDLETLALGDAITFKDVWYHPNNMILLLSGDITITKAKTLATTYYADWPRGDIPPHRRRIPPVHPAPVTLTWESDKIAQSELIMAWRMPSYGQNPHDARTLDLLQAILDGGAATRLYQNLVVRDKLATYVSFEYDGETRDGSTLWISATPAPQVSLSKLEGAIKAILADTAHTLKPSEREEALARLHRQSVFARDSVAGPAMVIGQALITGQSLEDIERGPTLLSAVTLDHLKSFLRDKIMCSPHLPECVPPLIAHIIAKKPVSGQTPPSIVKGPAS